MIFNWVAILLSLFQHNTNVVEKSIRYRFIDIWKGVPDSSYVKDSVFDNEFEYTRMYIANNIFEEKGLFSNNDNEKYLFLIDDGKWYYQRKGKWIRFFDSGVNQSDIFIYRGKAFKIRWERACIWRHNVSFIMKLIPPENMRYSHLPIYIFHPEYGIIAIIGGDGSKLVRSDLIGVKDGYGHDIIH